MTCAVLQPADCVHATHSAHDVHGGPVVLVVHVVHDVDRVHGAQALLAWQLLTCLQDGGWDANLGQVIMIFIMLIILIIKIMSIINCEQITRDWHTLHQYRFLQHNMYFPIVYI